MALEIYTVNWVFCVKLLLPLSLSREALVDLKQEGLFSTPVGGIYSTIREQVTLLELSSSVRESHLHFCEKHVQDCWD